MFCAREISWVKLIETVPGHTRHFVATITKKYIIEITIITAVILTFLGDITYL